MLLGSGSHAHHKVLATVAIIVLGRTFVVLIQPGKGWQWFTPHHTALYCCLGPLPVGLGDLVTTMLENVRSCYTVESVNEKSIKDVCN